MKEKLQESLSSVLPIALIVLLLSVSVVPVGTGVMVLFLFGAILLIFGMSLFTLGAELSMLPMGEGIGVEMSKSKKIAPVLAVCFLLGVLITVAEPDLQVLANQIPSIPNLTLILAVAVGVGLFLVIAMLRTLFKIKLNYLLFFFYAAVFFVSFFAPNSFIPAAFDSGGVTTGPMTVPFIMALGIGMASIRSDKNSGADSFGRVRGLVCSVPVTGVNQLIAATLAAKNNLSEETAMEQTAREQKHSLILITVNQGYTDEVMETAKKAGAMGGTILRARWKGEEHLEQFYGITVQSEKEIIAILAANTQRNQIMEQVNSKHGLHSEAHSVIVSVPVDRAFKLG